MRFIANIILWCIIFLGCSIHSFAKNFPFTDVPESSPYYSAVQYLYDQSIITDDGSKKFRGEETMTRDLFVGLSVSVSCRKCITPTPDDIIRYERSPFIDLSKRNPYFYCIAYAAEQAIVQGYIPDETGKSRCQDGKIYTSNPFCEKNMISRIEAVGVLLRQAKLWDDTMNRNYIPKMNISDTDLGTYWRGYAEKGIQVGILTLRDGKVRPNEYITRGEFAIMAAKMLAYNQCQTKNQDISVASEIQIFSPENILDMRSSFPSGYSGYLVSVTSSGTWNERWTLTHPESNTTLTGSGIRYPISNLDKCGLWIAVLDIIDPTTNRIISTSQSTFIIECDGVSAKLGLTIKADPLVIVVGTRTRFTSFVSGNSGAVNYLWNFGDSTTGTEKNPIHTYQNPGSYLVNLRIVDAIGRSANAQIVVLVIGDDDIDDDGIPNNKDICPDIPGTPENRGCPPVNIFDPYSGSSLTNPPYIRVSTNPIYTTISGLCIKNKLGTQGLIVGYPVCEQCPCSNTVELIGHMRSCDILFPTILSRDKNTLYSRGGLFQIP